MTLELVKSSSYLVSQVFAILCVFAVLCVCEIVTKREQHVFSVSTRSTCNIVKADL